MAWIWTEIAFETWKLAVRISALFEIRPFTLWRPNAPSDAHLIRFKVVHEATHNKNMENPLMINVLQNFHQKY